MRPGELSVRIFYACLIWLAWMIFAAAFSIFLTHHIHPRDTVGIFLKILQFMLVMASAAAGVLMMAFPGKTLAQIRHFREWLGRRDDARL